MTPPETAQPAGRPTGRAGELAGDLATRLRPFSGPLFVWIAFVLVHGLLLWEGSQHTGALYGDPALYRQWADGALNHSTWPVLDFSWVYPVGALVPVILPGLASTNAHTYRFLFEILVIVVDALAVAALLHAGRDPGRRTGARAPRRDTRTAGAWWWLLFLLCLGPISLVRLDGISAALTVIALAQLVPSARRPEGRTPAASAIATAAAWVKVAPGAVVLALGLTSKRPWRRVVVPAAVVSAVVIGLSLLGGSGSRVLGFAGTQDSRGLQVESGAATPFSIARLWDHTYASFYDAGLNVFEIRGPGTAGAAKLLDALLVLAVVVVGALTWQSAARLRRAVPDEGERSIPQLELVLLSTAALTLSLFVFDKVGSPQYIAWFAPPVAVALTAFGGSSAVRHRRTWIRLAVGLLVVALLTHQLFPDRYDEFLAGRAYDVISEAVRNVLIVVLAAWSTLALARGYRATARDLSEVR